MSVYIEPGSVEAIEAGVVASVNGREVTGPAAIWRNNFIREASWTPTGVDYNTSAQALSAQQGTQDRQQEDAPMALAAIYDQINHQPGASATGTADKPMALSAIYDQMNHPGAN